MLKNKLYKSFIGKYLHRPKGMAVTFPMETFPCKNMQLYPFIVYIIANVELFCIVGSLTTRRPFKFVAPKQTSDGKTASVYTDGCCHFNGKHGACGGIGVYWGPDDER